MPNEFHAHANLTKFDATTNTFEGVLALEVLDKANEIMDYEKSKPNFKAWSEEISAATGGKSVGNLRSMHKKHVAGKLTEIIFDDSTKRILVKGEVIDPVDIEKTVKGAYTGLSIGGKYGERTKQKDGSVRYVAIPREASLVDNPSMYGAYLMVKDAEGEREVELTGDFNPEQVWTCKNGCPGGHLAKAEAISCEADPAEDLSKSIDALTSLLKSKEDSTKMDGEHDNNADQHLDDKTKEDGMEKEALDGLQKSVDTLTKGFEGLLEKMDSTIGEKVEAAVSELTKNTDEKIEGLEKTLDTFKKGIEALVAAMPQYKGVRTVTKGEDSEIKKDAVDEEEDEEDESFEKVNDEKAARKAMKAALTSGVLIQ